MFELEDAVAILRAVGELVEFLRGHPPGCGDSHDFLQNEPEA
jgi:hypothetical protein